jgi:cytoskeleton-associated protein 5
VEAAELLAAALPGEAEAALAALDLLLRWAVLRLCDPHGNTTCLLRVLELCAALLGALAARGGQLSQFEAACFLPCLVEKAGHNQARAPALPARGSHA